MRRIILAVLVMLVCGTAYAADPDRSIVIDIGKSYTNSFRNHTEFDVYRLGVKQDFSRIFWTGERSRLSGYWEASVNYWDASGDEVFAVALSPVFVLSFGEDDGGYHPYIEGGIGAALLSDHSIAGRELSTTFQFEDRIGFGVRSDRFDFNYRYMHYSNGGIEKPNNGIDAHVIGMAFRY